jgi:hypothetical protein
MIKLNDFIVNRENYEEKEVNRSINGSKVSIQREYYSPKEKSNNRVKMD